MSNDGPVNPLDLSVNDPELEKDNYICLKAEYNKGNILCKCPNIT